MAITDKFKKGESLFATTLVSGISTGTGETITLASVTGLPTDTEITLTFDRVDATDVATPSKTERITGTISGSTLTSYTRGTDGSTEQAHSADAVVEYIFNSQDWNDSIDGVLVEHGQDGTHTNTVVALLAGAQTITGVKTFSVTPKTDAIAEKTAETGVTIDGVKLKDSQPYCDVINEKTAATGVTIDGLLIKDGGATITNAGTGNGLFIDQNGNGIALNIDSEIIGNQKGVNMSFDTISNGIGVSISSASANWTGGFYMVGAGLLTVDVTNASAAGNLITARNAGTGKGLFIDQNGNGTALSIDTEVANDGVAMTIAVAGTSPQPFTVYRNDDVTGNTVLRLGSGYVWVDATGDLRISATQPTSDTGGTVVGTQS